MPDVPPWPALPYDAWRETYATLHLWSQVVGKVALALAPPVNHSWAIALQVQPRGLSTRPLAHRNRTFTLAFDFVDHRLAIATDAGEERTIPLVPMSVAAFHRQVMGALADLDLAVHIWPVAVELPQPIRLDRDEAHHTYDSGQVEAWWRIVLQLTRALTEARCRFIGKASPAHFFWGAFDLALTRFSGRPAPPREGPPFMQEAYSHEVISHGFWPGNDDLPEAVLYGYAVPEPAGFRHASVEPAAAYYHAGLGEFLLPYEAVRTSADPDAAVRAFVESTYAQAATLGRWDRQALERDRPGV